LSTQFDPRNGSPCPLSPWPTPPEFTPFAVFPPWIVRVPLQPSTTEGIWNILLLLAPFFVLSYVRSGARPFFSFPRGRRGGLSPVQFSGTLGCPFSPPFLPSTPRDFRGGGRPPSLACPSLPFDPFFFPPAWPPLQSDFNSSDLSFIRRAFFPFPDAFLLLKYLAMPLSQDCLHFSQTFLFLSFRAELTSLLLPVGTFSFLVPLSQSRPC